MRGLSPYLYGIHDPGGESILAGKGQVLITESIGADPNSVRGADYSHLAQQGLGVIVRLNYSHHGQGTIPLPEQYTAFAETCARFVAQSRGCVIWIIGNEPNHPNERPQGQPITPQEYSACFRLCRAAIKQVGEQHQVLPAAVGPWNAETKYPGNEQGDWVQYFVDMLHHCGECDGITLHAYTRGASPAMVFSEQRMDAPFQHRRYSFRVYQDFLDRVPAHMRHLPVLITEIDEYEAWTDANTGVVQAIYQEIHAWNQSGGQPILAGILYRWLHHDQWGFQHKAGVHADLSAAIAKRYQWPQRQMQPTQQQESATLYMPSVPNDKAASTPVLPPRQWDERLDQLGVVLDEYPAQPGESYWRLVKAAWLDEQEAQGRVNIFVDVRDEEGRRVVGVPVALLNGGVAVKRSELKENDPYATDYALDFNMGAAGYAYAVRVDGQPSDCIRGMGLGDIKRRHYRIHVAYKLTFQRVTVPKTVEQRAEPPPEPSEPPTPQPEPQEMTQEWLVAACARVLGIEQRLAQAFVQVESGGYSFVNGRLVIRFEAHLFRDYLNNDAWFAQYFRYNVKQPWQDQQWRRNPNAAWQAVHRGDSFAERQAAEWEVFEFAASIHREAALQSISMGSAQIMGFNHHKVGYASPETMFQDYSRSALNQVVGLFAFCHNTPGLVQAMQRKDWWEMARLFNGEGQINYYAGELQRVYHELGKE